MRSYTELSRIRTFEERYEYLKLTGSVGVATFGSDRWLNQLFYSSHEWQQVKHFVRARDEGCDLGMPEWPIHGRIMVHHMNPLSSADLANANVNNLNPEYLITVTHRTHNAIHYGDRSQLPRALVERRPGDTKLW